MRLELGDGMGNRGAVGRQLGTHGAALVRQLVAERHRQRLSLRQLSDRLGTAWSMRTLQAVEQGKVAPSVELLAEWAAALGMQLTLVDHLGRG